MPAPQAWHLAGEVAPTSLPQVPRGHLLQEACAEAPSLPLQVPGVHAWQFCTLMAPLAWLHVPTGQEVHDAPVVEPVWLL